MKFAEIKKVCIITDKMPDTKYSECTAIKATGGLQSDLHSNI